MKTKILVIVITALLSTLSGSVWAQGKSAQSSIGTKELLARIEVLEAALEMLSTTSSDVTGNTYRTNDTVSFSGALVPPAAGQFNGSSVRDRLLTFNADHTATWQVVNCEAGQISDFAGNAPTRSNGNCVSNLATDWEFTQTGNEVVLTALNGPPISIYMTVSKLGEVVIWNNAGNVLFDGPQVEIVNGASGIGIRVDD